MQRAHYDAMINTLATWYGELYERDGVRYPLRVWPAEGETLADLLAASPPRESLTSDTFAFTDDGPLDTVREAGGNVYNGHTFALDRLERGPLRLHAKLGRYFDHMRTSVALEAELLRGDGAYPLRDALHAQHGGADVEALFASGAGRSAAIGVNTLVVYRQRGVYYALFTQRSAKTAHKPNALHVIPAFTFQPTAPNYPRHEWLLTRHIIREYMEELFGAEELEDGGGIDPTHPALIDLNHMIVNYIAELHFTGMTMNLMTTHVSVCSLLLIHDERWVKSFEAVANTWETGRVFALPIADDAGLLAPLGADAHTRMAPNGAAALWLGVDAARRAIP